MKTEKLYFALFNHSISSYNINITLNSMHYYDLDIKKV